MKKKIICITLLIILVIGTIPISAKSKVKSETIDDYLETSFDVYNIPIVDSYYEFSTMKDNDEIKPAIEDTSKSTKNIYTIKAKKNGCLTVYSKDSFKIYDLSTKDTTMLKDYMNGGYNIPIRKNDILAISVQSSYNLTVYIGFVPEEKIFCIDESVKNKNNTLTFTFGNVYGQGTTLSVYASKKKLSTATVLAKDILQPDYNKSISYDCTSILNDEGDAVLTLPERGEYTIVMMSEIKGKIFSRLTFILDTDKYIEPKLDALEEPISAVKGTNIIVGYAEPYNTVYVEYDGKKYEGVANRKGIYKIVLKKDMKEGVAFKIWQCNDKGLSSKKAKYRVTDLS
ncbi:MAG: hypothetical protein IKP88_15195 [Lachnospiraceae bacterium]|nr:hypothetical protein [Lachnospiraceae bacterium]